MSKISVNTIENLAATKTVTVDNLVVASDITAAVNAHASAADPHPTYATVAEVTSLIGSTTPAVHVHSIANVTGLQTALDGKAAVGSYAPLSHTHTLENLDVPQLRTKLLIDTTQFTSASYVMTNMGTTYIYKGPISNGAGPFATLPSTAGLNPGERIKIVNGADYDCNLYVLIATVYERILKSSTSGMNYLSTVTLSRGEYVELVVSNTTSSGYYVWDVVGGYDKYTYYNWSTGFPSFTNNTTYYLGDTIQPKRATLLFRRTAVASGVGDLGIGTSGVILEYKHVNVNGFDTIQYQISCHPGGHVIIRPSSAITPSLYGINFTDGSIQTMNPIYWEYNITVDY